MSRFAFAGRLALLTALAAGGGFAHAQSSSLPTGWQCDGAFSFSDGGTTSAHCAGSLSLTGVTLSADSSIHLEADQSLSLTGTHLQSPVIELLAGGSISIDPTSSFDFNGGSMTVKAGPISVDPGSFSNLPAGGSLQISDPGSTAPVPEPSAWLLLTLGACALAATQRRQRV